MRKIAAMLLLGLVIGACSSSSNTSSNDDDKDNGGSSVAAFCEISAEVDALSAEFSTPNATSPEAIRELATKFREALDEMAQSVPAEIKADFELGRTTFLEVIVELEKVDYDITKISDEVGQKLSASFEDSELSAAGERVSAYTKANCEASAEAGN